MPKNPSIKTLLPEAILVLLGVLTSFLGSRFLLIVLMALVAVMASRCIRESEKSERIAPAAAGLLSAAFPLSAYLYAQGGLLLTMAISVVVIGALAVKRGQEQGAVKAVASSLFVVFYMGFLPSYALLIRHHTDPGHRLIVAILLMLLVSRIATEALPQGNSERRRLGLRTSVLAVVGALLGAVASVPLMKGALGVAQMALLGVIVGSTALVGLAASDLITTGFSEGRAWRLAARLAPLLLALPAFFYGFQLYLH